jgi:membrane protein DedA with SNARE-associated domain
MADDGSRDGSPIIAALLLLALAFAGTWIFVYVKPDEDPWSIVPWFLGVAAVIVVAGLLVLIVRNRRRG